MPTPQAQHNREMFKQSNQAAIDFAKMLYQYLFLLNGAAAVALFSTKEVKFFLPAALFAIGALVTIAGIGIAYFYTMLLAETWRQGAENTQKVFVVYFIKNWACTLKQVEQLRLIPTLFVVVAIGCFISAITVALRLPT